MEWTFMKYLFIEHRRSLLGFDLGSDAVQISSALRGELATTIGVLLNKLQVFKGLQGLPRHGTRGTAEVGWAHAIALAA